MFSGPGWQTVPAQWREYRTSDAAIDLVFWHLEGRQLSGALMGGPSRWRLGWPLRLKQFMRGFPGGIESDEILVRISSNRPVREFFESALFKELIPELRTMGVVEGRKARSQERGVKG